jgi:hypothetical protein
LFSEESVKRDETMELSDLKDSIFELSIIGESDITYSASIVLLECEPDYFILSVDLSSPSYFENGEQLNITSFDSYDLLNTNEDDRKKL